MASQRTRADNCIVRIQSKGILSSQATVIFKLYHRAKMGIARNGGGGTGGGEVDVGEEKYKIFPTRGP